GVRWPCWPWRGRRRCSAPASTPAGTASCSTGWRRSCKETFMAELATLARPYANAVFDVAKADHALEQWSRMLTFLAFAAAEDKVRQMLESPDLPAEVKAQRLVELGGDELNERARNLVRLLARNKRLGVIGEIREQFEARK